MRFSFNVDLWNLACKMIRINALNFRFSTFRHLYLSCNDQALINATGFDDRTFNLLLQKFKPYYDFHTIDEDRGMFRLKNYGKMEHYIEDNDMCITVFKNAICVMILCNFLRVAIF